MDSDFIYFVQTQAYTMQSGKTSLISFWWNVSGEIFPNNLLYDVWLEAISRKEWSLDVKSFKNLLFVWWEWKF